MRSTLRPLTAEFLGTFGLVFIGAGAVVMSTGLLGIALAYALVLSVMISATMRISGGHINPAVTFAVWMAGKIDGRRAALYVVAQLLAAIVAILCVKWLLPVTAGEAASFGVPRIAPAVTLTEAILIEAILTMFLVSAVFGTVVSPDAPNVGGFGVGLVLLFDVLVGGTLTGAAMNPARAFGPALVSGDWHGHLAYWIGPLLGAAVAALLWSKLLLPREGDEAP